MKLSIVIPAFNEAKNLPKIIEALRTQTSKNFEIIVVDNNSKDETFRIAKKMSDKVYKCKKQGLSPARNFGAMKAKSEIVAFLDADLIPAKTWVENIIEDFENDKKLTAVASFLHYDYRGLAGNLTINGIFLLYFYFCKISNRLGICQLPNPIIAIRKDVFEKAGGFDDIISEDHHLAIKLRKLKNIKCGSDRRMRVICSTRRMEKVGIFKTHWIWIKAGLKRTDSKEYTAHHKL
jgi:glycosyltransferase involved in cell wall biosynthesis